MVAFYVVRCLFLSRHSNNKMQKQKMEEIEQEMDRIEKMQKNTDDLRGR